MHCKKKKYRDKHNALQALHIIQNKKDGRPKPIRVYMCDICRKWHLTSSPIDKELETPYKLKLDWNKLIKQQ